MAVTIARIAELAGVSRGTVDRALNDRGRVDPKVAARIRMIAKELGYQPNRVGKLLALAKKPLRIGVIVQSVETAFMNTVLKAAERARDRFAAEGVEVLIRPLPSVDVGQQLAAIDELVLAGVGGLALSPAEDARIRKRVGELAPHIPIVTFNTDLPDSDRMCYVGQDNYASGRTCAGLMALLLGGAGKVLVVSGVLQNASHQQRVRGFCDEVAGEFPSLSILPLETCGDDQQLSHDIVCRAVRQHPDLRGVYISVNGQLGACDAISELGLRGRVHLICHDLFQKNVENVRAGLIDFLIDQDAETQGVRPIELLFDRLIFGEEPPAEKLLTRIDIRSRYNL